MSTVVKRTFRSSPYRDAQQTWLAIVELLTQSKQTDSKSELEAITGIAASCISDQSSKIAPIIVTCEGPRTRIYCIYDDDAIDESNADENTLGFDPLKGEWAVSLPCDKDDLEWVRRAISERSSHITARDLDSGISEENVEQAKGSSLSLDAGSFLNL